MADFEHESVFPCSAEGLFQFLIQTKNIKEVSDPNLGLQFLSAPDVLSHGSVLDFKIVSFGQVIEITHKITEFSPASFVVETQTKGPMKSWIHSHTYETTSNGVVKRDRVEFQLPGGLLGFLLSEDKVIDQLEEGFFYRGQQLSQLIAAGKIQ